LQNTSDNCQYFFKENVIVSSVIKFEEVNIVLD